MSVFYNNILELLSSLNYKLDITKEKFLSEYKPKIAMELHFICDQRHSFSMKSTSYKNESRKFKNGERKYLCSVCIKSNVSDSREKQIENHCESLGFKLISFDHKTRKLTYECHCGNISETCDSNILKNTGTCPKCQNNKNKLSEKEVRETFKKAGLELLDFSEYKNNKCKLSYICSCKEKASACYHDIDQHLQNNGAVGCMKCRNKRIANKLTDGKYNNLFQIPEIKEKIKETCLVKYGFDHPMKNKEIKNKAEQTCLRKYGVKWAFTSQETYEKIKIYNLEKWGVDNCMKSKVFHLYYRAKIIQTCMERYGTEWFVMSTTFADKMMEKYGSKYFVQTKEFKKQMIEKYGFEHALQNFELFKKAMGKSFSTKTYTMPSGKVYLVMGYENHCLDLLLSMKKSDLVKDIYNESNISLDNIPIIDYVDQNKTKRRYFPDVAIIDENKNIIKIIEVKSIWTLEKDLEKNKCKFETSSKEFDLEVWVFDGKKVLNQIIIYKNGKQI